MILLLCYFFLLSLTSISCTGVYGKTPGNDTCESYFNNDIVCLPNFDAYEHVSCKKINGTHHKWIQTKLTMCDKSDICRCWTNDWYESECECVNARKFPSFPPTGVIRWKGTNYQENDYYEHYYPYNRKTVSKPGEMRKDADGRFLHKWTQVRSWEWGKKALPKHWVQFEIIVPHEKGKFMKLTGNDSSKKCKESIVNKEGSLNKVFKNVVRDGRTYWLHDSKPIKGKDSLNSERWRLDYVTEDGADYWQWTIKYDTKKKFAYPVQSWKRTEDMDFYEKRKWWYSYEPLGKTDISFSVDDYCDNV